VVNVGGATETPKSRSPEGGPETPLRPESRRKMQEVKNALRPDRIKIEEKKIEAYLLLLLQMATYSVH